MINLDPVFSSVSLRGRNLQMTLIESSLAPLVSSLASFSSAMMGQLGVQLLKTRALSSLKQLSNWDV